ncbi:MAG: DHHA1 domain-containing protein, partial [Nanopusillaceae archaeon]
DFMLENDEDLIVDLVKNYSALYNGMYFTVPYMFYLNILLFLHPYEISKNYDKIMNIDDFIKSIDTKKVSKVLEKHYNLIKNLEKIYESEKLVVYKSDRSGTVSTILSTFNTKKAVVVVSDKEISLFDRIFRRKERELRVSIRYQNGGKINIGKIFSEFTKEFGISGGGHPKAGGGVIYKKDLNNLIKFLESKLVG